mmetsp:Transcript_34542/g.35127  ORF Transcript_34542/g.35127 Transcript_34542/m.35127 type:complete len:87 (+) Transcript_34542:812-1072(+)
MVVESYGYHHNKLETHVTAVSFDWNTFDPFLTVPLLRGVSVADFFTTMNTTKRKKEDILSLPKTVAVTVTVTMLLLNVCMYTTTNE